MLRPLPRPVPPFRDETTTSFVRRLAEANRLDPAALRAHLAQHTRKNAPVPLGRLAAVTGMPPRALAYAMPQLCGPEELAGLHVADRPRARSGWAFIACRHCTASHVCARPVTRWATHDDVVCRQHRRWISEDAEQPDLSRQPEILDAHRRHRWLIRRHGRHAVMRAFRDAHHICIGWRLEGRRDKGFERRLAIFHGRGWRDLDQWSQTFDAATYPQSVALTRLLASPYWRHRIVDEGWPWHDEFVAELRRTVAPGYKWNPMPRYRYGRDTSDPLVAWKFETRNLELQPLPSEHPWNQPETITAEPRDLPDARDPATCPR